MDESTESHTQFSSNCPITDFEKAFNIEVPYHLKNIFVFCGYQNKFTISEITENDIEDMEKICREQLPKVISSENELKSYLGNIFYKSPSNFFITPGDKKIIRKLIEFCKNKPSVKRPACDKPDSSATKKRKEYSENFERKKQLLYNTNMEDDNLEMEKSKILNLITNWIKNICVKHLEREQLPQIFKEMNSLQIHLSESSSSNCSVTCSICLKDQKLFRNTSGCWITSNFQKHFKTHLPNFLKRNNKNMTVSEFFKIKKIENENLDTSIRDPQPGCSTAQKTAKPSFSIVSVESVVDESLDNVLDNLDNIMEIKNQEDLLDFSGNKNYFRENKIKVEL